MALPDWVEDNKKELLIGAVGLSLMSYGLWRSYSQKVAEDSVVRVETNQLTEGKKVELVVDVSGAVIKPGIYKVIEGARINDVLVMAGGLSAEADRGYVGRYMNLASKLIDGMKVYVPTKEDPLQLQGDREHTPAGEAGVSGVSINTASASDLDSLWGIGEARAKQIIDNRPYTTIEELSSKASVPSNVVERNKAVLRL